MYLFLLGLFPPVSKKHILKLRYDMLCTTVLQISSINTFLSSLPFLWQHLKWIARNHCKCLLLRIHLKHIFNSNVGHWAFQCHAYHLGLTLGNHKETRGTLIFFMMQQCPLMVPIKIYYCGIIEREGQTLHLFKTWFQVNKRSRDKFYCYLISLSQPYSVKSAYVTGKS